MSLLVVAYPELEPADYRWLQGLRAQHDELYFGIVEPHFTLVFPTSALDPANLVTHAKECAASWPPFEFVLRCALIGDDPFTGFSHVFLVPDEGLSQITKLHDRLYTGMLASELRLDLPYMPHLGVANSREPRECKRLIDDLNASNFEVRGVITNLDVIAYEDTKVTTLERLPLTAGS